MEISQAQHDVQRVFRGGFAGQLVSSAIWLLSAAAATWFTHRTAILILFVGGSFIFPLTQLLLRLMGGPYSLPKGHPMNALAMQIAFTLPANFPLIIAATLYHRFWFYPAFMIALGAHYLPFIFLYKMWQFGVLAVALIGSGIILGMYFPAIFALGAWLTAALLLVFAFVGRSVAGASARQSAS